MLEIEVLQAGEKPDIGDVVEDPVPKRLCCIYKKCAKHFVK